MVARGITGYIHQVCLLYPTDPYSIECSAPLFEVRIQNNLSFPIVKVFPVKRRIDVILRKMCCGLSNGKRQDVLIISLRDDDLHYYNAYITFESHNL